jgi:hypothetical protein
MNWPEEGDALAPHKLRIKVVGHAKDGVVDEHLDVLRPDGVHRALGGLPADLGGALDAFDEHAPNPSRWETIWSNR